MRDAHETQYCTIGTVDHILHKDRNVCRFIGMARSSAKTFYGSVLQVREMELAFL